MKKIRFETEDQAFAFIHGVTIGVRYVLGDKASFPVYVLEVDPFYYSGEDGSAVVCESGNYCGNTFVQGIAYGEKHANSIADISYGPGYSVLIVLK